MFIRSFQSNVASIASTLMLCLFARNEPPFGCLITDVVLFTFYRGIALVINLRAGDVLVVSTGISVGKSADLNQR